MRERARLGEERASRASASPRPSPIASRKGEEGSRVLARASSPDHARARLARAYRLSERLRSEGSPSSGLLASREEGSREGFSLSPPLASARSIGSGLLSDSEIARWRENATRHVAIVRSRARRARLALGLLALDALALASREALSEGLALALDRALEARALRARERLASDESEALGGLGSEGLARARKRWRASLASLASAIALASPSEISEISEEARAVSGRSGDLISAIKRWREAREALARALALRGDRARLLGEAKGEGPRATIALGGARHSAIAIALLAFGGRSPLEALGLCDFEISEAIALGARLALSLGASARARLARATSSAGASEIFSGRVSGRIARSIRRSIRYAIRLLAPRHAQARERAIASRETRPEALALATREALARDKRASERQDRALAPLRARLLASARDTVSRGLARGLAPRLSDSEALALAPALDRARARASDLDRIALASEAIANGLASASAPAREFATNSKARGAITPALLALARLARGEIDLVSRASSLASAREALEALARQRLRARAGLRSLALLA